MAYKNVESFKHRLAKELLWSWMRSTSGCLQPFVWRGSVEMELKFFENSGVYYDGDHTGRLLFVPDIVAFQRGAAHLLIEVVHKSAVGEEKLDAIKCFFLDQWIQVWEIDAEEILKQIEQPKKLRGRLLYEN